MHRHTLRSRWFGSSAPRSWRWIPGLMLGGCLAAFGCQKSSPAPPSTPTSPAAPSTPQSPVPAPIEGTPPVLSVTIVDLSGAYDPSTRRLGSLNCNFKFPDDPNDRWCFNAFGLSRNGRMSPTNDYKVAAGATVSAATAGVVTRIELDENATLYPGEYEIETRPAQSSEYLVMYDHVRNLLVAVGSTVAPGTVLGVAGIHTTDREVYGRVELHVKRGTRNLCARTLGTSAFNQLNDAALAAHNSANPAFAYASVCLTDSFGASPGSTKATGAAHARRSGDRAIGLLSRFSGPSQM